MRMNYKNWRRRRVCVVLLALVAGCAPAPGTSHPPAVPGSSGTVPVASEPQRATSSATALRSSEVETGLPTVDPAHAYTLEELIDLAESMNPTTRSAWERAKQAQHAVQGAKGAYLPVVSASVLAGYQHSQFPISQVLLSKGYFAVNTYAVAPTLSLKWLLFDFGARGAEVDALTSLSEQSTELFQFAHRKVLFEVTIGYHRLSARLAQLATGSESLDRAQKLAEAVEAKFERGLATEVEVTLARRDVAQARYDLIQQQAWVRTAQADLLRAVGASPAGVLKIEPRRAEALPERTLAALNECVRAALERRADVRAAFLQVRAAEARVGGAQSAYLPRVGVVGAISEQFVGTSIEGSEYFSKAFPTASLFGQIEWELLDGGLRFSHLGASRSRLLDAQHEFGHVKAEAIREVVAAYSEVLASVERYAAAKALEGAASTAAQAADDAFAAGLATLSDTLRAQAARSQAKSLADQAYHESLIAAATLAFAMADVPTRVQVVH